MFIIFLICVCRAISSFSAASVYHSLSRSLIPPPPPRPPSSYENKVRSLINCLSTARLKLWHIFPQQEQFTTAFHFQIRLRNGHDLLTQRSSPGTVALSVTDALTMSSRSLQRTSLTRLGVPENRIQNAGKKKIVLPEIRWSLTGVNGWVCVSGIWRWRNASLCYSEKLYPRSWIIRKDERNKLIVADDTWQSGEDLQVTKS